MKKENVKVILSRTWSPGNIGSIIRSMKNFDFTNVVAVDQINFDNVEMNIMAAGAKDHLKNLKNSNNLYGETKTCNVIYAFTARKRKHYKILSPREMAEEISGFADDVKVGLLFGNETNGLTNEETDEADKIVYIPTSENYSSLNLASSVMIALYELNLSMKNAKLSDRTDSLIEHGDKEYLFQLVSDIVNNKLMPSSNNQGKISENINHILKRVNLNKKEIGFITNILNIIDIKIP